jgi:integrase
LLKVPAEKRKPHIPWTDEAVAKWRAEARPMPLLGMELGIGTAQRPGDLPLLRWGAFDGENLTIEQGKTGAVVVVPCTPELRAALAGIEKRGLTILTNHKGQPLTWAAFRDMMARERERLGTLTYDLHGMRYRGVMELAWAGCTDDEIMSYSGHATQAMVKLYAGKARQITRAKQAAERRERNRAGTRTAKLVAKLGDGE